MRIRSCFLTLMVIARRVQRLKAVRPDREREMRRSISFSMCYDKISCRRVCRVSTAAATKLALVTGDIVEFVDPVGAPVRAWVDAIADDAGELAWLGADVLPLLRRAVDQIEVRRASPRRLEKDREERDA